VSDLEDDWRAIRALPAAQPTQDTSESLRDYWATLRALPEVVFVAHGEGYGAKFSLWRMAVVGEKKVRRGSRDVDCWLVKADKLLFFWGGHEPLGNGSYAISKEDCHPTFEVAAEKFARFREEHQKSLERDIRQHEARIRSHFAEIKTIKGKLVELAKVDLTPEATARNEARSELLSVLVQRMEQVEMQEDLGELSESAFDEYNDY
jgi:hypothetical protein